MSKEAIRVRLQELKAKLCCISDQNAQIVSLLSPQVRRATVTSSDTNGSTLSGAYSVSIANVGAAAGSVNGVSIPVGTTLNFDAGVLNNTLGPIPYDASGTTFIITYITD